MDTLTVWLLVFGLAIPIYAARASFIFLFSKFEPPVLATRALRFVPVAIFVSLIVPELLIVSGQVWISVFNPKLIAGVAAVAVAGYTRNTPLTLVVGMAVLHGMRWFSGV